MNDARRAAKILVAEDDAIVAESLRLMLETLGYSSPDPVCVPEEIPGRVRAENPTLILLDIRLGETMAGLALGREIREKMGLPVIYVTGYDDEDTLLAALDTNPYGYLPKPVTERALRGAIESALHRLDMEERLAASERALRESEARYRGFVQSLPGVACSLKPDGAPDFVEGAVETVTGYTGMDFAEGRVKWDDLIHPEDAATARAAFLEALRPPYAPQTIEYRLNHKSGRGLWIQARFKSVPDPKGRPWRVQGTMYDVTEAREAQAQARAHQETLQRLTKELANTAERERRRIATELHDRIAQNLIALKMRIAAAAAPESWPSASREAEASLDETIREVNSLCFEISSPILYHVGLAAAMEWLVEKWRDRSGVAASFSKQGPAPDLDHDSAAMLYQAVRELLNNCAKHAHARRVRVSLRTSASDVRVSVKDDGSGFQPGSKTEGYGLLNVQERIAQAGGCCRIESAPGEGAKVELIMPRTQAAPKEARP